MSVSLINKVKYSPVIYKAYSILGNLGISLLKLFVKPNPKAIVFVCFGGRKYDDSPKAIYEEMVRDSRFDGYQLVWAFINPEKHDIGKRGIKIKIDTLRYFTTLLSARVWITNSSVERGLHFTGKHTFYLNTWHGTPIKKMGTDIAADNASFGGKTKIKHKQESEDVMLAQGIYEADIFSRVFRIRREKFAVVGLPRNDELVSHNNSEYITMLKDKLGLPRNKKVILYAPTYREYSKDDANNVVAQLPIHFNEWKKKLGDNFVVIFRAHYEVVKTLNVCFDDFIIDFSAYPQLNDLMLVSDILISDYSSIFFDYSILKRPMLSYAYDYDTYTAKRGMYFDIRKELECLNLADENALLDEIVNLNYTHRVGLAEAFKEKYIDACGTATQDTIDIIAKNILAQ
jgi:CDP-glycerol glycerophosphotransferase